MAVSNNVAVIGAGPYGLAVAAHLHALGVRFRIFGVPLQSWRSQMPSGMFLKSEGFASNLYDPDGAFTLKRFCADNGLAYADQNRPVPLSTFTAYSTAFQRKFVPEVEETMVVALERQGDGFRLSLDSGETFTARRIVIATGLSDFRNVPAELAGLPASVLSHAAEHREFDAFAGRDVSVVGAGASALDVVAALREAGANARLVARRSALKWNMPIETQPWIRLSPVSGMGGGWRNFLFESAPMAFRCLPQNTRHNIVRRWLGPAGGWPARKLVEQGPILLGQRLREASYRDGRAHLRLTGPDGRETVVATDHVIAATGYKVDIRRMRFLNAALQASVRSAEHTPVLSPSFESSVPGLYFVGLSSANTFGPVMRFLVGARYAAQRVTRHISRVTA
jgi:cation diffusion facilitator CzcD-associated flavoprotein CzcO